MIKIESLQGLDTRLYQLVAPLVMNPRVLRYNNNYPFKTSKNFIWYVALSDNTPIGFIPVEIRDEKAILNNYYVAGDNLDLLSDYVLEGVVQTPHVKIFEENGFNTIKEWKKYVKMEWSYGAA